MRNDKIFLVLWMMIQASSWRTSVHFLSRAGCIHCHIWSNPLKEQHYLLMIPLTNASRTLQRVVLIPLHSFRTRAWIFYIITSRTSWTLNNLYQILWGATLIHQAMDLLIYIYLIHKFISMRWLDIANWLLTVEFQWRRLCKYAKGVFI